jgi:hypothetical protein
MHMAEGPVVIALGGEFRQATGGIAGVTGIALQGRMQDADIEPAGHRGWIGRGQIFQGRRLAITATMEGHLEVVEPEAAGLATLEGVDIVRQGQLAGHLALGIVIAMEQINGNASPVQPPHFPTEVMTGIGVSPVAIVEIAGDDHEIHGLLQGQIHQPTEGIPGDGAQPVRGSVRISGQPREGAVQVDIGGVDEFHEGPGGITGVVLNLWGAVAYRPQHNAFPTGPPVRNQSAAQPLRRVPNPGLGSRRPPARPWRHRPWR